jgi:hypothetical protein
MQLFRYLQHWLTGRGPCFQIADFVPETPPLRPWAETFPWAALVAAVDRSFAQRFSKPTTRGTSGRLDTGVMGVGTPETGVGLL